MIIGNDNKTVESIAKPIIENILNNLEGDYKVFTKDFYPELIKKFTLTQFQKSKENVSKIWGKFLKYEYLGFINAKEMTTVVYKAQFSKTNDEIPINILLDKIKSEYFIKSLNI